MILVYDLRSFKAYLEKRLAETGNEDLKEAINGIQYTYALHLAVYTQSVDGVIIETDAEKLLQVLMSEYMGTDISAMMQSAQSIGLGFKVQFCYPQSQVVQQGP